MRKKQLDEVDPRSPRSAAGVEKFLGFEPGTFDHIPHYARGEALYALRRVRDMERRHIFRSGLYYIVLSDLCRATEASTVLGNELSKKRIETFILTCVESLGRIETTNYHVFLREIGDAVLMLFSSFRDAYEWWRTMQSWLDGRNSMWALECNMPRSEYKHFKLNAKTIIHAGEVDYSDNNIPLAAAVNQVFKIEKKFKEYELGISQQALSCVRPMLRSLKLSPKLRDKVKLPGDVETTRIFLLDNYSRYLRARDRWRRKLMSDRCDVQFISEES